MTTSGSQTISHFTITGGTWGGAEAAKLASSPDLAPWVALARVLLNTDEFITRE